MTQSGGISCVGRLEEANFCSFYDREDGEAPYRREKRRSTRVVHEEPVVLETQEGELIGAVVMNYSRNGLYFESDFKIHQGTVVRIRNESTLANPDRGGCRAEVRWSTRLPANGAEYQYGAGVRYC